MCQFTYVVCLRIPSTKIDEVALARPYFLRGSERKFEGLGVSSRTAEIGEIASNSLVSTVQLCVRPNACFM